MIPLSQLVLTAAPIRSIFEFIESILRAVYNIYCFTACNSLTSKNGSDNFSAFLSCIFVVEGISISNFLLYIGPCGLASASKWFFHLIIFSFRELISFYHFRFSNC